MNFKKERNRNYYLKDTHVENVFINEYMPPAPGDYVKVYLFALMYADLDLIMTNEDVARHLNMAVEDVLKAWTYWESMGVVKKYYADPNDKLHYEVAFQDMKSAIYGKNSRKGAAAKKDDKAGLLKNMLTDEELRALYGETEHIVARPLSGGELQEILGWMTEYGATAEVILFAWRCAVKKGKQDSVKYVGSMVKDWSARGFRTASAVTAHLEDTDNRFYLYRRVLKALGMTRNATEEEKRIMDNWSDAMKLSLETILEACKKTSGISNPNINYVNSVLKAWSDGDKNQRRASSSSDDGKGWQIADVFRYYEKIRAKNEREANERRE
ncbi:MAG: DnaD domain protein, partial [Clostridiales Family XIII bacterium]|nr:DnaD domain protein [Clostridiales Family XIII bacterium]